jgi:hypothetical protein
VTRYRWRVLALVSLAGVLLAETGVGSRTAVAFDYNHLTPQQRRALSGFADSELSRLVGRAGAARTANGNFVPTHRDGCPIREGSNLKVNQNCMNLADPDLPGRGQAANEPSIAADPMRPSRLVAAFNDYRAGEGHCGAAYSQDGGKTWADSVVPSSFTRGAAFGASRQYWEASGDPSVSFDTRGNVYLACQGLQRGGGDTTNPDLSSAVYVFRSTGNGGASWVFPGRPVVESADVRGTGAAPFEDKPYLTVDNHPKSPFRDRIYVTYSEFTSSGILIFESYSDDYGEHFSPRVQVFTTSPLCPVSIGAGGSCDFGVDAQPFTGPDGALYVVYDSYNNSQTPPFDNHNQVLLARSQDGGRSFGPAVKVADFYDLPDCASYQQGRDLGRSCVPEKNPATANSFFRAINYPSGTVNPRNPNQVTVAFGSYINPHSNETTGCAPNGGAPTFLNAYTGVKAPGGCANDILVSVSSDGGRSFTGGTTDPRRLTSVTPAPAVAVSDRFWQWAAFTDDGTLAVSYYDRQYGSDAASGFSDISVSTSTSPDLRRFEVTRVTANAFPPPTQFEGTFYGDYAGLAAVADRIHPVWADTRDPELFLCPSSGQPGRPPTTCTASDPGAVLANNQEIFTASLER